MPVLVRAMVEELALFDEQLDSIKASADKKCKALEKKNNANISKDFLQLLNIEE